MKKISRFTYLLSLIVCVILGIYVGSIWSNAFANRPLKATNKSAKIKSLFEVLEKKYVDSVDEDMLSEEAIITILEKLDPHSDYIKAKDLERVNSDLEGHFSGIGVTFNIQIDTAVVINVISGGPAEKVGVLPGDRIVEINDTTYVGKDITSDDFVSRLRGPKHTNVKIGVKRSSSKKLLHFTIKRGDIPVNSVDATFPIAPKIGYIKVGKFAENTYNEFVLGLLGLYRSGCNRFIIDL
ncbi:MAG TPA: peptidase S41, partial [Porphyromonadaceae bacterium]|nr:peptidase S41 [Porphyromonadaceae bacterium]